MNPMEPWHLWGTTEVLRLNPDPVSGFSLSNSPQLARAEYKRPESWSFFFAAQLHGPVLALPTVFWVNFDLIFGVGRATFSTKGRDQFPQQAFCPMRWNMGAGSDPEVSYPKYASSFPGQLPLDDSIPVQLPNVDRIVAQSINVEATARATNAVVGYSVEVFAFIAPFAHVRPDWFCEEFAGKETGGK